MESIEEIKGINYFIQIQDKTFCLSGIVNPNSHFYVDPSKWNKENIIPEIKRGDYPLLIAPSQSGKTTRVIKLKEQLKSNYLPIY